MEWKYNTYADDVDFLDFGLHSKIFAFIEFCDSDFRLSRLLFQDFKASYKYFALSRLL